MTLPTLYSFRRCPYAMRARLGIYLSGSQVLLREIVLKHKPQPMLDASPKGTVPVLILQDGEVIDESLDIMIWALKRDDPDNLLLIEEPHKQEIAKALIDANDYKFKPWLDKYKYADRHPEQREENYREQGEQFIAKLETLLAKHEQLLGSKPCIADFAIFPFVRQFAHVNKPWFRASPYPNVQRWLSHHLASTTFTHIMKKYPTWLESEEAFLFGKETKQK
ncbi:glutathione S-transferase [Shewanella canadensis]|uniref:Glutathione S-transferase n=1 Tax=Shewanella canadensis TaxID=271096 RepID=A0A431WVX8_9GAMM|nr:glutathione S-transferase [Shewanella canadensis]RTR39606.1 glutathione S-transferase [Shewanella canadensis]